MLDQNTFTETIRAVQDIIPHFVRSRMRRMYKEWFL